ncbi:MAG: GMP synthase [Ignavibacteriales bacterium]|nr:GMP synthase [Ignavibacteriales bacterium]
MNKTIKIATIDLYNGERNEGMRCIRDLALEAESRHTAKATFSYRTYETRLLGDVPTINDFDVLISSGGPGDPFDGEGTHWEKDYFNLMDALYSHNESSAENKKYVFFICHSFQLMARYFKFADVNQRYKKSFGIWGFQKTVDGQSDIMFKRLNNPFYAADFRQYQVVNPNEKAIKELGASILSTELPHSDGKESALMAVRVSDEIAGTQFHPEADADSMIYHFRQDERKQYITEQFGEQKYYEMLAGLEEPDKIKKTRSTVIPSFLDNAINKLTL